MVDPLPFARLHQADPGFAAQGDAIIDISFSEASTHEVGWGDPANQKLSLKIGRRPGKGSARAEFNGRAPQLSSSSSSSRATVAEPHSSKPHLQNPDN